MKLRPVTLLNKATPALTRLTPTDPDQTVLKARSYAHLVTRQNVDPKVARQMLGLTQ